MSDQPLTYEGLFDTLRREKSRDELQALERNLYSRVRDFLATKEDAARSAGTTTLAGTRAQIEHQNARKILRELYERRERKIVTMALHRLRTEAAVVDTAALLPEEESLFAALCSDLERNRSFVLAGVETPAAVRAPVVSHEPLEPAPRGRIIPVRAIAPEGVSVDDGDTATGDIEEAPFITVRFTSAIPKFAGPDGIARGPFNPGDEGSVPRLIAEILLRKGKAEVLSSQVEMDEDEISTS
jgi:DNA replication initiation complex subunit (GINS family)